MDKITEQFNEYIKNLGISKTTLKNYRSDINNFTNWLINKTKLIGAKTSTLSDCLPFITSSTISEYTKYLKENASVKTVNRRLSTLRKFGRFLNDSNLIDFDLASSNTNITEKKDTNFVDAFEHYLTKHKIAKNTVKNYMSDIKQFTAWLESQAHLSN